MNSTLLFGARLIRRQLRRWQAMLQWQRLLLSGVPVLFANSFPKSGTHLLTQVLQGFPRVGLAVDSGLPAVVTYQGDSGRERGELEILADVRRFLPGDIGYGHIHAMPGVINAFSQPGMAAYFILRDPRDVAVSHVHYVTEMEPNHAWHRYYNDTLHSFEERLLTTITGLPGSTIPFPDIAQRFAPYLDWLDCPEVLTLHFENFITDRSRAVSRVFDHAVQRGFSPMIERQAALKILEDSINPERSPTFRSGKVGGWKQYFREEHIQVFKELAGKLLVRLGYEKDLDW